MKKTLFSIVILLGMSANAATKLACWDKRSSSRKPTLTATIVNAKTLTDVVDSENEIEGVLVGETNAKAIKYKGYLYFSYGVDNISIETILPADFSQAEGYFDAASRGTAPDGGGTTQLRCRVN